MPREIFGEEGDLWVYSGNCCVGLTLKFWRERDFPEGMRSTPNLGIIEDDLTVRVKLHGEGLNEGV